MKTPKASSISTPPVKSTAVPTMTTKSVQTAASDERARLVRMKGRSSTILSGNSFGGESKKRLLSGVE